VVTNFRKAAVTWALPKNIRLQKERVLISNYSNINVEEGSVSLHPFEAFTCFVE
jgi:hypothetical protein